METDSADYCDWVVGYYAVKPYSAAGGGDVVVLECSATVADHTHLIIDINKLYNAHHFKNKFKAAGKQQA